MQCIDKGCDYFYDGDEVACYVDEKRILMKVPDCRRYKHIIQCVNTNFLWPTKDVITCILMRETIFFLHEGVVCYSCATRGHLLLSMRAVIPRILIN